MLYPQSLKESTEIAKRAYQDMRNENVPPNPMNFTIWYGYVGDLNTQLKKDMDTYISNKVEFTEALNQDIFAKYFTLDPEAGDLRETSSRIHSTVSRVLEYLGEAGKVTADHGEKIAGISGEISEAVGPKEIRKMVRRILAETDGLTQTSGRLSEQLNQSTQEIEELKARLEEIRMEAMTDALTGIGNRRHFDKRLREGIEEAVQADQPLSLMMTDIDHFKKFNDVYGHKVGDGVLKIVGRILKNGTKGRDTPARYGGEEFAVILPNTLLADAVTVAEQIRMSLDAKGVVNRKTGERLAKVTISIGVAQYRPGEPMGEIVARADEALYQAKRGGRNQVVAETALAPLAQAPARDAAAHGDGEQLVETV